MDSQKALRLVQGLLAKAESTHSQHEADALVAKAQALMLEHSIDEMQARQRGETGERPVVVEFEYSTSDTNAAGKVQVLMAACLGAGVKVVDGYNRRHQHRGRVRADGSRVGTSAQFAFLAGYENDVVRAQMLFASLMAQAARFARDDIGTNRSSRMFTSYLAAFGARVRQRFEERLAADAPTGSQEYGLVVVRDEAVQEAMAERVGETREVTVRLRTDLLSSMLGAEAGSRADIGDRRISETRRLT